MPSRTFAEKQWLQAARNLMGLGSVFDEVAAGFIGEDGVERSPSSLFRGAGDIDEIEDDIDVVVVALASVNGHVSDGECQART